MIRLRQQITLTARLFRLLRLSLVRLSALLALARMRLSWMRLFRVRLRLARSTWLAARLRARRRQVRRARHRHSRRDRIDVRSFKRVGFVLLARQRSLSAFIACLIARLITYPLPGHLKTKQIGLF